MPLSSSRTLFSFTCRLFSRSLASVSIYAHTHTHNQESVSKTPRVLRGRRALASTHGSTVEGVWFTTTARGNMWAGAPVSLAATVASASAFRRGSYSDSPPSAPNLHPMRLVPAAELVGFNSIWSGTITCLYALRPVTSRSLLGILAGLATPAAPWRSRGASGVNQVLDCTPPLEGATRGRVCVFLPSILGRTSVCVGEYGGKEEEPWRPTFSSGASIFKHGGSVFMMVLKKETQTLRQCEKVLFCCQGNRLQGL